MGMSVPWPIALEGLTGETSMDATLIRSYFQPLEDWLRAKNIENGDKVGWPGMPNESTTYDPNEPTGSTTYDPNEPTGSTTYDPNEPTESTTNDPTTPPENDSGQIVNPSGLIVFLTILFYSIINTCHF